MTRKANMYGHALKILSDAIVMRPEAKEDVMTIGDIDIYRNSHPVNGQILSRYKTMANLYGVDNADRIMRGLEVKSWVVTKNGLL